MLMKDIQTEQATLEQKLSVLRSRLQNNQNTESQIEQFKESIRECMNIQELTPYILNKLIAKIEIGCVEVVDSEKQQEVRIEWKFYISTY